MTPGRLSTIAIVSLILIFISQIFLVYDYFNTTKAALIRESDAIVEDVFRRELDIRREFYKKINHEDTIVTPPPFAKNKIVDRINLKNVKSNNKSDLYLINIAINMNISRFVPISLQKLDSVCKVVLSEREIHSRYRIAIINTNNNSIIQQTGKKGWFTPLIITSNDFMYDLSSRYALRLQLINPFGLIIQRMGFMLLSSIVLALICISAFFYLQRILARQKQLVAFKNDFLSNIAHELKRPVASLTFNLDALSMSGNAGNENFRAMVLRNAVRSTNEMNDVIQMIVTLSKLEEGLLRLNISKVDIVDTLHQLRDRFLGSATKNAEINIDCSPEKIYIQADQVLLNTCFANIIDNALKYSGDEVKIQITVWQRQNTVTVLVEDNGNGITADKLPVIFERYNRGNETNRSGGYGIGLNYVKTIVEKHGGTVRAESEPGKGSRFTVEIPG